MTEMIAEQTPTVTSAIFYRVPSMKLLTPSPGSVPELPHSFRLAYLIALELTGSAEQAERVVIQAIETLPFEDLFDNRLLIHVITCIQSERAYAGTTDS
jgi:hypothetical protein